MPLSEDFAVLRRLPEFADFDDEEVRLLAFGSERFRFREGHVLFDDDQRADRAYVICAGRVRLERAGPRGAESSVLAEPGSLIGEGGLYGAARRLDRAVVVDEAEVICIRRGLFRRLLEAFPERAASLFKRAGAQFAHVASALDRVGRRLEAVDTAATVYRARKSDGEADNDDEADNRVNAPRAPAP